MITANKRFIGIVSAIALLLLIPFTAMQFTSEVQWSATDFLIAAAVLLAAGCSFEFVLRKVINTGRRRLLCAAVLFLLVIVWLELAVGILGTPFAGS